MQKEEQRIQHLLVENSTSRTAFLSGFAEHFKHLGCVAGVTGNIFFALRRPHYTLYSPIEIHGTATTPTQVEN